MPTEPLSRREFTRHVTLGATALPIAACLDGGVEASASDAVKSPGKKPDGKSGGTKGPDDLLLEVVKQQYPHKHLDEKVLSSIRAEISANLAQSKILGEFPLKNSDEPVCTFSAYRGDAVR